MDWEQAIIDGIDARQQADTGRWRLGDLAMFIEAAYGQGRLSEYANVVGVSYPALRSYRWVAGAYEKVTRVTKLSWSHHRVVAANPKRLELLQEAEQNNWRGHYVLATQDFCGCRIAVSHSLCRGNSGPTPENTSYP